VTIDLDEQAPPIQPIANPVDSSDEIEDASPAEPEIPADSLFDSAPPQQPEGAAEQSATTAPKARKQIRTPRRGRTTRRPVQPVTAVTTEPATTESNLLKELSERVTALEVELADNRRSVSELDQALAAAVEKATTDELIDAKQRVQAAAGSMAALVSAISDSAASITTEVSAESATALLISFAAEVENVLLQLGFTPLNTSAGEPFDPARHRSLRRVSTSDQTLDKVISKVIRDGYQSTAGKRILLYSDVEVNRFVAPK